MEIKSTLTNSYFQPNLVLDVVYHDIESEKDLEGKVVRGASAYCFYQDKLVVVYSAKKNRWTLPGGKLEQGESARAAVEREVQEEANMKVLRHQFIGYQDIYEPAGVVSQTRSVCLVEPIGPFVADPDGDITEIKLIDPKDYKQYFDWGEIGNHLITRASFIKTQIMS